MRSIFIGLVSGLIATVPMTAFMRAMHRRLPRREQYPLPPRHITENAARKTGVEQELDEPERRAATRVAHYGFGTTAGALYGPLAERMPLPPVVKGVAYGLAVWAGSYLGWLPAAGLFPSAVHEPPRRNALMIGAHVIWGAVLGEVVDKAQSVLTAGKRDAFMDGKAASAGVRSA